MNVKNEMNPCHSPIQNPAISVVNFSFPGAHELKKSKMLKINKTLV